MTRSKRKFDSISPACETEVNLVDLFKFSLIGISDR